MADTEKRIRQITTDDGTYDLDANYWGGKTTSDVKTINGHSILESGDIVIDWSASNGEAGYIKNKTHYYNPYSPEIPLYTDDSTVGTNICSLYTYFKLGDYVYKSSDILNKEFNCQTAGSSVIVKVVKVVEDGVDNYYLQHVSGDTSSGAPIMISGAGVVKHIDDVYIPETIARKTDIATPDWNAKKR
jgi:hypothetical protein